MVSNLADRAPKVELHLHLEGAIPHETMWSLVKKYGDDEVTNLEQFKTRFRYRDFAHFIDVWTWMTGFYQEPADFTTCARDVAASLVDQNIIYAEASVSPSDYRRHGLSASDILMATRAGLDEVDGVEVALLVDLVRDGGREQTMRVLHDTVEVADDAGVVGITIGGLEDGFPPELFVDHFELARSAGLGLTAHAGEAAGPEYVWSALHDLDVDRIGHGVRSVEDPSLVDELVSRQIPLEVCPTSNIRTGVAAGWEGHPVFELLETGANVSINSDDPSYFDSHLGGELRQVADRSGFEVEELTVRAIDAAFTTSANKDSLRARVTEFWNSGVGQ